MQLVVADASQRRSRDALTHAAWGQRLAPGQFARREEQLRGHPWSKEAMTTWLLTGDHGEVLASCETFRMRSRLLGGDEGSTYGVASVYTEPDLRGRGHAAAMMALLTRRLQADDPSAQASILFSEVGPTLYRQAGYVEVPWLERILPAQEDRVDPAITLLPETRLAAGLVAIPEPPDPFLAWPSALQLDWYLERERIYAELLERPRPAAAGATLRDSTLIWAADPKNERLCVLLGHAPDPEDGALLLRAAAALAADAGLRAVHLWESAALQLPIGLGRTQLAEDLPMIRPLHPALDPEDWRTVPRALWV